MSLMRGSWLVKPQRNYVILRNFFWQLAQRLVLLFVLAWAFGKNSTSWAGQHPAPLSIDWGATTYSFAGAAAAMTTNQDALQTNPAGLLYFNDVSAIGGGWVAMPQDSDRWNVALIDGGQDVLG